MAITIGTNSGLVTATPTGDPAEGAYIFDGKAIAQRVETDTKGIIITEMGWYASAFSEEAIYEVGVYDGTGQPRDLLFSKRGNYKGTGKGWKTVTGLNWTLAPDTYYWITIQMDATISSTTTDRDAGVGGNSDEDQTATTELKNEWTSDDPDDDNLAIYAKYTTIETNSKINISDTFKDINHIKINIDGTWKEVIGAQVNIGDVWKTIF